MHTDASENYLAAARALAGLVATAPAEGWEAPALGGWDLRALVGHAGRALVTVCVYLGRPAEAADLATPEDYVLAALHGDAPVDPEAVLERGRQAGRDLGPDPAAGFAALVGQARDAIAAADAAALVTTVAGGMRVDAYLPTRTLELAVHGLDVARVLGRPFELPPPVLAESAQLATRVAVRLGHGPALLAGLTGPVPLPAGFSVVG